MKRRIAARSLLGVMVAVCLAPGSAQAEPAERFDVVLAGGMIYDGLGGEPYAADIGIIGDTIVRIGDLDEAPTSARVDVEGLVITPGFIDLHSHADGPDDDIGLRSRNVKRRAAPNLVSQGVTTVVVNQDGRSPQDISRQRQQLEERGTGVNTVLMVGHNTIRRSALYGPDKKRPATEEEIDRMRALVRLGMEAGAYGLTAGLEYEPGIWSTTDELIALVREIVPYGGVYIVHERSSGSDPMWVVPSRDSHDQPTMLDNINEVIAVGEATGATVVATHIKARGVDYWGQSEAMVASIEEARARGVEIYADQYPYTSSGSDGSIVLLPDWVNDDHKGEPLDFEHALMEVLKNPERMAELEADIAHEIQRRGGAERIMIMRHPEKELIGKSLAQAAFDKGMDPVQMVYLFQIEGYTRRFGGAVLRGFSMDIADVERFTLQPWVATASDAGIALREDGLVHARYYGTFPRKIRQFAMTRSIIPVEFAIRSMTGLPAHIMRFPDRGRIAVGAKADIAVLDLEHLHDMATYFRPHQYAQGVEFVFVNGQLVVAGGRLTGELPGSVVTPVTVGRTPHTDD